MVDHVEPPEERNGMKHDVLKIDGEVKDQHTQAQIQSIREWKLIQKAPTLPSSQESQSHQGEGKDQANKNGINQYKAEITHPPRRLGCGQWATGCKKLPDGHDDQNSNEKSKPDE